MSKSYERRRMRNDPKGDRRYAPTISPVAHPVPERVPPSEAPDNPVSAELAIMGLLDRGDGWLRITAPLDLKSVYLKWKFSDGKHRGKYVMVVCHAHQLQWGLSLLLYKCYKVDENQYTPSVDTPYDYTP